MGGEGKAQGEGDDGLVDRIGPGEDLRVLGGPNGHVGGVGMAQDEGGDGLGDRIGPSEDLRALGGPHGHVGSEARPRVKLMMDLGIDLDLVKISEL